MNFRTACLTTSRRRFISRIPAIMCLVALLLSAMTKPASAVVVDGRFDAGEGYGFVSELNYKLDKGGTATGIMYSKVAGNGDVFLFFTQPLDVVDNSYGAKDGTPGTVAGSDNSIGWNSLDKNGDITGPKTHTFKELRDSDKATVRLTDGNGTQVLDFTLDYLADFAGDDFSNFRSAGIGNTKDGTAPAGTLKAEGGITLGNPDHILVAETTMGSNFATYGPDGGHFGEDSHSPEVADNSGYPAVVTEAGYEGWIFEVGYEMQIDAAAFGGNGFGEVQEIEIVVHDSPVKQKLASDIPVIGTPTQLGDGEGEIGNFVWHDLNEDGIQDAGEVGVENVKVTLTSGGEDGDISTLLDNTMAMAFTDFDGLYLFDGLEPNQYKVTFGELPSGATLTLQDIGLDDTLDSDADALSSMTQVVTLTIAESNLTLDAGLIFSDTETVLASVPEPSAAVLALLGLLSLGTTRRRRRR
jgi:hypothetical protein